MFRRRRERPKKELRIILGTKDPRVFSALAELEVPHRVVAEAITCDGLYRALAQGADLVIADLAELGSVTLAPDGLREILSRSSVPVAAPQEFAADPRSWQEAALAAKGFVEHMPPRCVAIASYSGGVGKTTIALDAAALFAQRTGLPALVAEFCYGASALRAICGQELPDVYDCLTEGKRPGKWRQVDILPMDPRLASMLKVEQIGEFLDQARRDHVLTLLDAHWPHQLWPSRLAPDLWLVVGTPKPDGLSNAMLLAREVGSAAKVVINMVRGRMGLVGYERDLDLPFISAPERYDGRLGGEVLKLIYTHWH